ncbi:MAG: hypothetical protein JNK69_07270 [Saprospiraceae bacterium]|nr:hypothetical protein [Candidatus Vicinibacter proximus]MBL7823193.1 hypothetical protein [Saprospiraceae bacterium]MCC6844473.1 hypothetical protein [Saprospiraceae bacterium]HRG34404.1 hypothetical protein [Saprospiraceae bacterium]
MKVFLYSFLLVIIFGSCSSTIKLDNLNRDSCGKFEYGKIETKRMLTDGDKLNLKSGGIVIQEFVFENLYLGIWKNNWSEKNLDKTVISKLTVIPPDEKLAGGVILKDIKPNDNSRCILLIQTVGSVPLDEFDDYGKVESARNDFIKMETSMSNIIELCNHPCIKAVSLLPQNSTPDQKKD